MSIVLSDLYYSEEHEWIKVEGNIATIGITDYAQEQLGDIVYVSLPEVGNKIFTSQEIAVIESVKTASELYSPISGEVLEVNEVLQDAPEKINADAMGEGWICKIKLINKSELTELFDETAYNNYIKDL